MEAAAQTAYDAHDYTKAATLYQQLLQSNPVYTPFWQGLADSEYAGGQFSAAIVAYKQMLSLGAQQPSYCAYDLARAYAQAGDTSNGMHWLQQSMDWGYPLLESARSDPALGPLKNMPGFNDLLGIVDPSKMDRVTGWRYDLRFLARYIKTRSYHPFKTTTGDRFISRSLYSGSEFDQQVARIYNQIPNLSNPQIEVAFMRLVASLGDGHSEVGLGPGPEYTNTIPLKFETFQEGIFITAASPAYHKLLGAKLLGIDGHETASVISALTPLLSRDNDNWIASFLPQYFRYPALLNALGIAKEPNAVSLQVRGRDGTPFSSDVGVTADAPYIWNQLPSPPGWANLVDELGVTVPLYLQNNQSNWLTYDSERHVLYVQYNRVLDFPNLTLAQFAGQIENSLQAHEVDKLVIDMRWNNGGNTHLNQPILELLARSPNVNRRGHLFVIIGPRTFSAALNSAAYFERNLNAIFVGEPTGGRPNSAGEEWFFTLPYSKIYVSLSNLYWESGWPDDSRWAIAPELYAPRTFADYLAGRDLAMEDILQYQP